MAYASKHGSTAGIAQSIAETIRQQGAHVDARPVGETGDIGKLDSHQAFVIGSAVYYGLWRREATRFAKRHSAHLASRPVWLFSSGPLGTKTADPQRRDLLSAAEPKVIAKFRPAIAPRGHRVFFGALDLSKLGPAERLVTKLLAWQDLVSEGNFRDQADICAWATGIAQALDATQAAAHQRPMGGPTWTTPADRNHAPARALLGQPGATGRGATRGRPGGSPAIKTYGCDPFIQPSGHPDIRLTGALVARHPHVGRA